MIQMNNKKSLFCWIFFFRLLTRVFSTKGLVTVQQIQILCSTAMGPFYSSIQPQKQEIAAHKVINNLGHNKDNIRQKVFKVLKKGAKSRRSMLIF